MAAAAPPALAQEPAAPTGTIRGTVYDSLLRSPLAGAEVWVVGASRSAITDQRGRYTLDSVPAGAHVVAFGRPDLDSIGLSSFAARVTVGSVTTITLPLAVPSHDTYWRMACGAARGRTAQDSGLVFGTVTDAESRHRIAGARVTLTWIAVERDGRLGWVVTHPTRELTTDSLGTYYACGIPVEYLMTARGQAGGFHSGRAEVLVDSRGIARRDLSVSREVMSDAGDTAAPVQGLATLVGTVRGERGGVLPGAVASLDGVEGTAEADSDGRFVLRYLPAGTQSLLVRRIGYFGSRQVVDLRNRVTIVADVTLSQATVLDTIRVFATPLQIRLIDEIDERRRVGFGYFLSGSEASQRPSVRSLFDGFPSIHVVGTPFKFAIFVGTPTHMRSGPANPGEGLTGGCRAQVVLDGVSADEEQLQGLLPSQIMAVEVYPRPTIAIQKYLVGAANCGAVLVWTKWAR